VCIDAADGVACAASNARGELGAFRFWSRSGLPGSLRFADVDGDGKADACSATAFGITCARNLGGRFDAARPWLVDAIDARGMADVRFASSMQLADVDGDGRADACGRGSTGVVCALSTGKAFAKVERWSTSPDFAAGHLRFGDLNGDGRDDVCGPAHEGIVCALSTARGFTRATVWLTAELTGASGGRLELDETTQLGDVNGDGRADLCTRSAEGVSCALAP
jgi:hypothetical protein